MEVRVIMFTTYGVLVMYTFTWSLHVSPYVCMYTVTTCVTLCMHVHSHYMCHLMYICTQPLHVSPYVCMYTVTACVTLFTHVRSQ